MGFPATEEERRLALNESRNRAQEALRAAQWSKADVYMEDARAALRMAVETGPVGSLPTKVVERAEVYFAWFQQKRKEHRESD